MSSLTPSPSRSKEKMVVAWFLDWKRRNIHWLVCFWDLIYFIYILISEKASSDCLQYSVLSCLVGSLSLSNKSIWPWACEVSIFIRWRKFLEELFWLLYQFGGFSRQLFMPHPALKFGGFPRLFFAYFYFSLILKGFNLAESLCGVHLNKVKGEGWEGNSKKNYLFLLFQLVTI